MTPVLKRVGVVVHPGRPAALALGKELVRWATDHGVELRQLEEERDCLGSEVPCVGPDEFPLGLDLVVVLGGDGTLLRAVGLALRAQVIARSWPACGLFPRSPACVRPAVGPGSARGSNRSRTARSPPPSPS